MKTIGNRLAFVLCLVLAGAALAKPAAPAKSWRKDNECSWWLAGADGKSHRASIAQSSDGVLFSLTDPAFASWSETDQIKVELRADHDDKRVVAAEGWVTRVAGYGMLGFYLEAEALTKVAGAGVLEVRRDRRVVVEQRLRATPKEAELLACVPVASSGSSDSE